MISIVALVDNKNNNNTDADFNASITSIINQTYKEWELKIVLYNINQNDVCSIQNYKDVDDRIDIIKYVENEIKTPSNALIKVASDECKYEHIALLFINDAWVNNKLELAVNTLLKYPRIDVLGGQSIYENEKSCIPEGELCKYNILKINPFVNSSVVIKKNVLKNLELLEVISEDLASEISAVLNILWIQLAIQQCILYNMSDITVKHNDSSTFVHYKECYDTAEFKKVLNYYTSNYIRVKFFSDYCVSGRCKEEYERACLVQNIEYYGKTKKIYFTTTETYTHAIILNCPTPQNLQVPARNVIGFAQEPPNTPFLKIYQNNFINYAVKNIGKYFIGSVDKFPTPTFAEHHGFLFYETPKTLPFTPQKSKLMSIMVSHKTYTPGHQYRHDLVRYILKHSLPIDIWGNGADKYKLEYPNNKNIKGSFKSMEEMCKDYSFTIAIENTSHDHYFTEKIINPFINNTVPIYWGCKKVEEYFPKHTVRLTGDINRDVIIINNVLKNPNKYINEYKIDQEMVLNKVNIVKNIERMFIDNS